MFCSYLNFYHWMNGFACHHWLKLMVFNGFWKSKQKARIVIHGKEWRGLCCILHVHVADILMLLLIFWYWCFYFDAAADILLLIFWYFVLTFRRQKWRGWGLCFMNRSTPFMTMTIISILVDHDIRWSFLMNEKQNMIRSAKFLSGCLSWRYYPRPPLMFDTRTQLFAHLIYWLKLDVWLRNSIQRCLIKIKFWFGWFLFIMKAKNMNLVLSLVAFLTLFFLAFASFAGVPLLGMCMTWI